jgi:hypothetical protein
MEAALTICDDSAWLQTGYLSTLTVSDFKKLMLNRPQGPVVQIEGTVIGFSLAVFKPPHSLQRHRRMMAIYSSVEGNEHDSLENPARLEGGA